MDADNNRIYVQGVGWVDAVIHRKPSGKLKNITVTANPPGCVYASCLFEDGYEVPAPVIPGNDLNLECLAVCSDGTDVVYRNK